jgi:hypothetical protein
MCHFFPKKLIVKVKQLFSFSVIIIPGLSLGFKPKDHVTLSPAALRVKYKGMGVKNTIFQTLGIKFVLKQIFSSIFTLYLI